MAVTDAKYDLIDFLNQTEEPKGSKGSAEARMYRYLEMKAREKGIPIKGTFELTPICNLDCKMCYVHLTDAQYRNNDCSILSGNQWKQIARQAIEAGALFILLTGGEAMLHPDFDDIYLYLQEQGVNVSVNTNGLLLTEKRIDFFKQHRPREIRITLYGADEETYERVTGHRVFSKVREAILRAKEAELPISVNITPNKYARDNIDAVFQLVDSLGVNYSINFSLTEPRKETGRDNVIHDMTLDDYIRFYKRINQLKGIELQKVCEDTLPKAGGERKEELRGFRCGGGRSSFSITWKGVMQSCLTFSGVQMDVVNIPFSEAWKTIHNAVCEYLVPIECEGCPYMSICPVCVVKHAEGAPLGHANPELCKRAKRLMSEGLARLG